MTKPPGKTKPLDQYLPKKGLLSVKPPPTRPKPLAPADKAPRKPKQRKPIPQVENQTDLRTMLAKEDQSTELDIVPDEPVITDDPLLLINTAKRFDDILPLQWYFKWRWMKILNNVTTAPCIWQQSTSDSSILKLMYGVLQALLSVTAPEFVPWNTTNYRVYRTTPLYDIMKSYIAETSIKLCLFAAFKLNNIDLAFRIPMLRDYMAIMGLQYVRDICYDRLMYIKTFTTGSLKEYCYVITTVYDDRLH
jgi:integrase